MSHKTKVKAGGSMPPSVEEIIRSTTKARVMYASQKRFVVQASGGVFGMPTFSRMMSNADVVNAQVKRYCN